MRIGMILDARFPPDIRVEKEALALIEEGHEVIVLSSAAQSQEDKSETYKGIQVVRIPVPIIKWKKGLIDAYTAIGFVHPIFKKHLGTFIRDYKIDVFHVHDLPLAKTALKVARKMGLKVYLDMHENYPEGIKNWFKWKKNPIIRLKNKIFFSYNRWLKYEGEMCKKVDHIIAVVDEMKDYVMEKHQIPADKITVVTNSEPKDWGKGRDALPEIKSAYDGKFVLSYVGGFGPHRGLDTVIEAMPEILKHIPNAVLLLVGKGSVEGVLREMVAERNLGDAVEFIAFQPFEKVFSFMKISNVNLVPHHRNNHTDHTIPHKLFQIMQTGSPLLVSDCKPLKRIVENASGGFVFEAGNPADLAKTVIEIFQSPEEANSRAQNAVTATQKDQNWEATAKELNHLYSKC